MNTAQVRMECEVVADTSVSLSVTWKKDNVDLGGDSRERITVDANNTLVIRMVNFQDEGEMTSRLSRCVV